MMKALNILFLIAAKVFTLTILLGTTHSVAQDKVVIHQNQQWLEYTGRLKISDNYTIVTDLGSRWIDSYLKGTLYYIRAGVDYKVNENVSLHAGFAYVSYFYENKRLSQVEYRPYQEMSIRNSLGKISIFQRLRIEERFFEPVNAEHSSSFNWYNWRFRYMIIFDVPLFSFSKENPDYRLSLGVGDEIMLNAGKSIVHNQFSQNRFLIIPTVHLGDNLNVAFIWSMQYSSTFTPNRYIRGEVFWLQVIQKFDLTKKRTNE